LRKEPNHNARNRFQSLHQQLQRVYEKFDSYVDYFYQPCRYDGFAILSKYLKEDLNLSYAEVGWIMVAFGMGSMLGSWLGGKLSDKIGFTKSWFSVCSPAEYYFFHTIHTSFLGIVRRNVYHNDRGGYVSRHVCLLATYSKPENRTRSLTLVRLAVNLGFAAGPALGGLIIMNMGYGGLFWVDGSSCIISILILH
jgi:predicted MFS family arabinose efflux permease